MPSQPSIEGLPMIKEKYNPLEQEPGTPKRLEDVISIAPALPKRLEDVISITGYAERSGVPGFEKCL